MRETNNPYETANVKLEFFLYRWGQTQGRP